METGSNHAVRMSRPVRKTQLTLRNQSGFLIGNPDTCIETLEQYEAMGVDGVMCSLQQGPTTHQEAMNTIRLFGEYVIPHFREKEQKAASRK